jgi:L-2,4-diaminobutyrate decarboxylase
MEKLKVAYDSGKFNAGAKALVDILTQHLENASNGKNKANNYHSPEESLEFWSKHWEEDHSTEQLFQDIIERSIHIHNTKYIGHQVTPTLPIAGMASFLSAMLNNGMANYEMGNVASTLEKLVVDFVLEKFDWKETGNGFLTSGGTLANLTALLAARNAKAPDVWENGYSEKLVVFITEEAHYCVERALRVMGLGNDGIIKIPTSTNFKMDLNALNTAYNLAIQEGKKPIAIVASACSTSTGVYDDIEGIANFCETKNLWLHIDGAHGAAVIFSDAYRHLIKGIDRADSIVLDAHKMMMVPALCTYTLFRNKSHCNSNFAQKAQYLWEKADDQDWYNYGRKTFECTKYMMSIKIYAIIKEHGEDIFTEYVDTLYQRTHWFAKEILEHSDFELLLKPESNILCFRYTGTLDPKQYSYQNKRIRQYLLEDGEYYIVQTELEGETWLRISLMNPFTTEEILSNLLHKIVTIS